MSAEASLIYLREVASGAAVEAMLLDSISEAQLVDWEVYWRPAVVEKVRRLRRGNVPTREWPQSWHWNWPNKMADVTDLLAYRGFSVVCLKVTQGLMRVDLNLSARIPTQRGKPIVYVEYLEVAPWNRPEFATPPQYRGVGKALLTAAVELSLEEGFKGRIGLHSLPQADRFYAERCGMTDLGRDAKYQNLKYFEMTAEQAAALLEGSRP